MDSIGLAVDTVLFGYEPGEGLGVLLIKRKGAPFKGRWALPGGFVRKNELPEDAARRELMEETGVNPGYLEQLYTFGAPKRDPRGRVVSVAHYGTVKRKAFAVSPGDDAKEAAWFLLDGLPSMAFDHAEIIEKAKEKLREKLASEPLAFELLDDKFPFSDLQRLYETVRNESLDRRNFKKKFMSLGLLDELREKSTGKGRPGSLFRFSAARYRALKKKGISFEIS